MEFVAITGNFEHLKNKSKVQKYVHKILIRLWRDCIKEFILATADNIAVDTGMSKASLIPLAREVQLKTIIADAARGFGPRKGYTDMSGTYHPDQVRSPEHGERLGQSAYTLEFGTPTNPELLFNFNIVVFQYFLHESLENYQNSSNWKSLEKGKKAFLDYWNKNYDKGKYEISKSVTRWLIEGVIG